MKRKRVELQHPPALCAPHYKCIRYYLCMLEADGLDRTIAYAESIPTTRIPLESILWYVRKHGEKTSPHLFDYLAKKLATAKLRITSFHGVYRELRRHFYGELEVVKRFCKRIENRTIYVVLWALGGRFLPWDVVRDNVIPQLTGDPSGSPVSCKCPVCRNEFSAL